MLIITEYLIIMKYIIVFLVCLNYRYAAFSQSGSLTVVIIRHGEKNEATGNLSCKGLHRALLLPHIINGKFSQPSSLYVPTVGSGKMTAHARMFQTASPLAVQDNLSVNSKFAVADAAGVAGDVLKRTGVVLLVWEHENIPENAAALGVKDKHLKWDGPDFDSIWVITYTNNKKGNLKAELRIDKEGLNPPEACNF
jgi:hypothetical protein